MTTIVVGGDHATTTAMAIGAGWPLPGPAEPELEVVVIEADRTGGSLAAWLDTPLSPSLSSVVAGLHQGASSGATRGTQWSIVEAMVRRSASGLRFVPAPFRTREARGAVDEAERTVFPLVAAEERTVALLDVGRFDPLRLPRCVHDATLTLVVHRQDPASAPAATVRLERLAEAVDALQSIGVPLGLAVVGEQPFSLAEVVEFTELDGPAWTLATDPLSAAVLAGQAGVSARRLARLPLMRTAAGLARDIAPLASDTPAPSVLMDGGAR